MSNDWNEVKTRLEKIIEENERAERYYDAPEGPPDDWCGDEPSVAEAQLLEYLARNADWELLLTPREQFALSQRLLGAVAKHVPKFEGEEDDERKDMSYRDEKLMAMSKEELRDELERASAADDELYCELIRDVLHLQSKKKWEVNADGSITEYCLE